MVQKSRLRVGAVSFLNTKPLIYPLLNKEIQADIALTVDVPSRVAALLSEDELDVGLIPIIEYFRANPSDTNYCILPDISIASHGSVQSIQLFSRVPIQEIRRIALDTNSRTSVALLKILLTEKYGVSPAFTTCAPTVIPSTALQNRQYPPFEAVLLIGDPALRHLGTTEYSVDLGEAWYKLTGLPFVYACWVAREEAYLGDFAQVLFQSKERGVAQIPEIAQVEAQKLGLPETLCLDYLQNRIKYDLDEPAIAGIELFYKYAVKNDLAPPCRSLTFQSC
ncbi:menaquinone biosynthesis protein [Candidatus Poribacteria bacterium]|nr:menaquinone biosynthesis protein [Candidatus Poribacteria bacterium]MYA99742.1 menaquinone biosynthesis protein [Candidatus Poribacteria bacterium]